MSGSLRAPTLVLLALASLGAAPPERFDVLIRGGTVYDGTGRPPVTADVGLRGDRIVAIGALGKADAETVVDASGLAVAPGFINMLSWSTESLIVDGRSQGEVRQGVTTQIFGEGFSMGPLNDALKQYLESQQVDVRYEIPWTTLAEYLSFLERKGIAQNVASYIGATTIRAHVIGFEDRKPTPEELERMRELVRREMEAGALGIGSSLIYAPASYSTTEELIELSKVAAKYKGKYISHMRSEGDLLLEAVDELVRISREAGLPAEIYHLKAAGEANWPKLDQVIAKVEAARRSGLEITADMYTYPAGATSLSACIPPWAHAGGDPALLKRLAEPDTRARIASDMKKSEGWENLCLAAGSPERVLFTGFSSEALRPLSGKTLGEVAKQRGKDPIETVIDLVLEDKAGVGAVFFLMSEDNIRKQVRLPWVSFGSDAPSMAAEGVFLKQSTHPRAYGNFARLLGKYVREERLVSLQEAIRRLTGLPAANLGLEGRGLLKQGLFGDVVVFDPARVADRATFEAPHQYSVGVRHVFVNGVPVLRDGEPTGALPGRALAGPGAVIKHPAPSVGEAALIRLEREVARLAKGAGGRVGMSAIHLPSGRRVSLNGGERFPMASSYKVPIAVQLLDRTDRGELSLDRMVELTPRDLHPGSGTIASLLNKPGIALSVRNLLELMLLISDNSATDLLLDLAGGPAAVTARLRGLGIDGIDVNRPTLRLLLDWSGIREAPPESEWSPERFAKLHEAVSPEERKAAAARFDADPQDTATPDAMAALLARIQKQDLLQPATASLLLDILLRCQTGEARLKGILPPGTPVAHKTGTVGGTTNDVGIVTLPEGAGHVAIAVFVKSSDQEVPVRERVIAQIARAVHDFFLFVPR